MFDIFGKVVKVTIYIFSHHPLFFLRVNLVRLGLNQVKAVEMTEHINKSNYSTFGKYLVSDTES